MKNLCKDISIRGEYMKIAVIGPGSMGLLYGAKLSAAADVTLVGQNPDAIRELNQYGITIVHNGQRTRYSLPAFLNGEVHEPMDLIILFTKSYLTEDALQANKDLIGRDTILLTLQNGKGHEEKLRKFTDEAHILIGTTAQGSSRTSAHSIVHSGLGETVIGDLVKARSAERRARLEEIVKVFEKAGFPAKISDNISFTIWNKLMINASSSVLSGVLQVAQGYVGENEWAWKICQSLIKEICDTADGEGCSFDYEEQVKRIQTHLRNAPRGYTSIYSDLKNGRKTEVDTISGAVVSAAKKQGKSAPVSELMVNLVHAMEER